MKLFTENQVNHVYVVNSADDIEVGKTTDGTGFYFTHTDPDGNVNRSDIIYKKTVEWNNVTRADDMSITLKKATITLNSNPVVGEDYFLRLAFTGYIGISPEDSQYWKYACVHVTSAIDTKAKFYTAMKEAIELSMKREAMDLVTVTADSNGIHITETISDWIMGLKQQKVLSFDVYLDSTIAELEGEYSITSKNNFSVNWGTVVISNSSSSIPNGKLMADYEYFFHGERGDQYRLTGWPDYIPTKYLVDPTATYSTFQIHYSYSGPNEDVQKSGKDITILINEDDFADILTKLTEGMGALYSINEVTGDATVTIDTPELEKFRTEMEEALEQKADVETDNEP